MLAPLIDLLHALLMLAWVLGLPLLVWRRHARLSRAYAVYALTFVVVSQVSQWLLGECFLTTLARFAWESQPPGTRPPDVGEWFTVRAAKAVFGATPSHRAVVIVSEALILATAVTALWSLHRAPHPPRAKAATVS
jgi:hypothetical protein